MSNASNLSTLANVLDDASAGEFLKSTGSGGVAFDTVAAGAVVYATADLLPLSGFAAGDMAYVTDTNRFYINNGSGWYSVSLVNTNPNITSVQDASSGTTPFTLATDGTATVITVTAADPEDVPVTYGYSVTTGNASLNGSTVAQGTGSNSNVFTVTPHASQDATFTITFTASDGINQATSANAFSLSFVTAVTDSNHTTLLATATGTSDNNNITDSSSNSHSITVNGDAHAGTFSPYRSGGYSTYFDGTGDYLTIPASSSLDVSLSDTTIEGWFYTTSTSVKQCLWEFYSNDTNYVRLFFEGGDGNKLWLNSNSSGVERISVRSSATLSINTWYHIAVTRTHSSGAWATYINGSVDSGASGTESASVSTATWPLDVGRDKVSTDRYWNGYISDFRIVKGSAITPPSGGPTERLEAVTNTSLLTCHLPYIADGSTNDHSVTPNGDVCIKPFSPYDYEEYDAAFNGGSVYFDGTGDALEISDSDDFDLSGGSWTIECWWYPITVNTYDGVFSQWNGPSVASGRNINVTWESNKLYLFGYNGGTFISSLYHDVTASVLQKKWNHIAAVFDGTKTELYLNGKASGRAYVSSTNLSKNVTAPFRVAKHHRLSSYYYSNSYISDVRVNKGTAVYTSDFIPPTAPLSSSGTSLHIKGTDASIIDKSQGANLKLVGDTTGSTDQVRTGVWANTKTMKFDGSGDYISFNETYDEFLESGTVGTIEWWGRLTSKSPRGTIIGNWLSNSGWTIDYDTSHRIHITRNGSTSNFGNINLSFNVWHHYAVVNSGTGLACYIDGTQIGTLTNFTVGANSSGAMRIGQRNDGSLNSQGYIQDFRITKGLARYTAADETSNIPSAPLEG